MDNFVSSGWAKIKLDQRIQDRMEYDSFGNPTEVDMAGLTLEDKLFGAVRKNELDTVIDIITHTEVDVNKLNNMSKVPLLMALENENIPMVKALIDHGADINQASYCHLYCTYETPLVTAARLQNMELVELLLDKDCHLDANSAYREGKTAFQWASTYGDISMAELLLSKGADIDWLGMFYHTALHYATIADKSSMVKWLLSIGAEISTNGDGRTPLHIAAVRGNLDIVEHLVDRNCEMDTKDNFNFTPLALACLRGHYSIVCFMLENAKPGTDFDLDDGLHRAAESGHVEVISYLLERGANVNSVNSLGESALTIASRGQYKAVSVLVERGANINIMDNREYSALQLALLRDQIDIATLLILHGANLHTNSSTTDSPLKLAVATSNPVIVKYLIQAGCDINREAWFTTRIIEEKIREFDFQSPGHLRFRWESDMQKEVWRWLKKNFKEPRTLRDIVRITIREALVKSSGGISVHSHISVLPLPNPMKKYLTFEDILLE